MPVLANARYERFAQGIAKGKSQHDSYIYAGFGDKNDGSGKSEPKDVRSNAGTLARKPEVAKRIQELVTAQAKRVGISVDDLLVELNEMLILAKRCKQPAAGVGAIIAKGKLLGLITDKVETDTVIRKPSRSSTAERTMSMDEWKKKFAPGSGGTVQ